MQITVDMYQQKYFELLEQIQSPTDVISTASKKKICFILN